MFIRLVPVIAALAVTAPVTAPAQERFSFFQASTPENVQRMLTMAALRDDDVVVDLGSGDGLIPLTAARLNPRLRGSGVDIDPKLVEDSNEKAREQGVADRVHFEHRNAFDVDLRDATVVTMWLFPELMRLLRPVILERARPGTRVLTTTWNLGSWKPDQTSTDEPTVYMWIVPARVAGSWEWTLDLEGRQFHYGSLLEQRFQEIEGAARADDRREVLESVTLRGTDISFILNITLDGLGLTRHEFSGKVNGEHIEGTVKLTASGRPGLTLPWRARRTERAFYFAPTGTEMFRKPLEVR